MGIRTVFAASAKISVDILSQSRPDFKPQACFSQKSRRLLSSFSHMENTIPATADARISQIGCAFFQKITAAATAAARIRAL